MIFLSGTTDKLRLVTGQAVTTDVHAAYADYSAGTVTLGRQNTAISTATTTDIVAAPAASTIRKIKALTVRNRHASSSVDVTVTIDVSATLTELAKTAHKRSAIGRVLQFARYVLATRARDANTLRYLWIEAAFVTP